MDYLSTPQWTTARAILTSEIACYPEAQRALLPVLARLSNEREETVHLAIGETLKPFLDARIAIAQALMHGH